MLTDGLVTGGQGVVKGRSNERVVVKEGCLDMKTGVVNIRTSLDDDGCNTVLTYFYWLLRMRRYGKVDIESFSRTYLVVKNGHKISPHAIKWTDAAMQDVFEMRKQKISWKQISEKYDCSESAAQNARQRYLNGQCERRKRH